MKKPHWTPEQVTTVGRIWKLKCDLDIARMLNRKPLEVCILRVAMGWVTDKHWSPIEERFVEEFSWWTDEQLAAFLPGRTPQCIRTKRSRMGLLHREAWTMDDIRHIESEIPRHTDRELAEELGRTKGAITQLRHRFHIKSPAGHSKRVAA